MLTFHVGDGQTADFEPASFDAVLCSNGLIYMADIALALKRWAAWLRPAGSLSFNTFEVCKYSRLSASEM